MKRALLTALQILITAAILVWVFHDPQKRAEMWAALRGADPVWLLVGFAVFGGMLFLGVIRLQILLRVQGIRLTWGRVASLFFVGLFFNLFLLGATGGDVVKVLLLMREAGGRKTAAFLAVVMDRLVGMLAMIVLALLFLGLRYRSFLAHPVTASLAFTLLAIVGASGAVIAVSFLIAKFGWAEKLPARMPMRQALVDLAAAYVSYGEAWRTTLLAFLISLVAHLGYFGAFDCAARALRAPVSTPDLIAIMPVVNTISSLPISVSGVGMREVLFKELLTNLYDVPAQYPVPISMVGFSMYVAWCAIGGIVYAFYRSSGAAPPHLAEAEAAVTRAENQLDPPR